MRGENDQYNIFIYLKLKKSVFRLSHLHKLEKNAHSACDIKSIGIIL